MSCKAGKEYDAGLCYNKCNAKYYGVGPVCWAEAPKGWVGCGMGAASSSSKCAETIVGQISSVGEMAINIATFGSSAAATKGATSAAKASRLAKLKAQFVKLKNAFSKQGVKSFINKAKTKAKDMTKEIAKDPSKLQEAGENLHTIVSKSEEMATADPDKMTAADYIRLSAEIAAVFDPTGAASVVASFSHPKCN